MALQSLKYVESDSYSNFSVLGAFAYAWRVRTVKDFNHKVKHKSSPSHQVKSDLTSFFLFFSKSSRTRLEI